MINTTTYKHTSTIISPSLNNQFYFQLLPVQLTIDKSKLPNYNGQTNYWFKLGVYRGLQKFDENKTPLYSQTNDEKIVFNFDKTHLLSFFLPVYNSLRQVDFKLSLLASTDGGNQFFQVGNHVILANSYIVAYQQQNTKCNNETVQLIGCKLSYELYVDHTRMDIQKSIKENHPDMFAVSDKKSDRSRSSRNKIKSSINADQSGNSNNSSPGQYLIRRNLMTSQRSKILGNTLTVSPKKALNFDQQVKKQISTSNQYSQGLNIDCVKVEDKKEPVIDVKLHKTQQIQTTAEKSQKRTEFTKQVTIQATTTSNEEIQQTGATTQIIEINQQTQQYPQTSINPPITYKQENISIPIDIQANQVQEKVTAIKQEQQFNNKVQAEPQVELQDRKQLNQQPQIVQQKQNQATNEVIQRKQITQNETKVEKAELKKIEKKQSQLLNTFFTLLVLLMFVGYAYYFFNSFKGIKKIENPYINEHIH